MSARFGAGVQNRPGVVGVVLAAGAGRRYGMPKCLVRDDDGGWLPRSVRRMRQAGVSEVVTVLGAAADAALELWHDTDLGVVVIAPDWAEGLAASTRAGLHRAGQVPGAERIVLTPVDLPRLPVASLVRLLDATDAAGAGALARATWRGQPGHPVVLGSAHLPVAFDVLSGDSGLRGYLSGRRARGRVCRPGRRGRPGPPGGARRGPRIVSVNRPARLPLVEPRPGVAGPALTERYARQIALPGFGVTAQARLAGARVAVVGCGGLGAPLAELLAGMGVGTIGLIDGDVVERSNLHRQPLYAVDDVGSPKAVVAARALLRRVPEARVTAVAERLDASNADRLLNGYDLVCDGTDRFEERYLIDDATGRLGLPVVWGALSEHSGQVSVFWRQAGVSYRDVFPDRPAEGLTAECLMGGMLPTTSALVAALMAQEALKLITGLADPLLGRLLYVDALTGLTRALTLREPRFERHEGVPVVGAAGLDAWWLPGTAVLDVREPSERGAEIPGAHAVPLSALLDGPASVLPPDSSRVLTVCAHGAEAWQAADVLRARGWDAAAFQGTARALADWLQVALYGGATHGTETGQVSADEREATRC